MQLLFEKFTIHCVQKFQNGDCSCCCFTFSVLKMHLYTAQAKKKGLPLPESQVQNILVIWQAFV